VIDAPDIARALERRAFVVDDAPYAKDVANLFARAGAQADAAGDRLVVAATREECARALSDASPLFGTVVRAVIAAIDAVREPRSLLRMRDRELALHEEARIMGILNVTPDSFFDHGRFAGVDRARARAAEMVEQGAAIVDIGGRSYAHSNEPPGVEEELRRVVPVVEALVRDDLPAALSIDTVSAAVAEAALAAGAHLINDCSGLADPAMAGVVARADAALVVMHLKGELNVRAADEYVYDDVMGEITEFLADRIADARSQGVGDDAIVVDPGLEFGKEPATDCEILDRFAELTVLGRPILFAASRKSFIGRIFDRPAKELLAPSLASAAIGIAAGARLVRVHDVAETYQVAKMYAAVRPVRRRELRPVAEMPG
jgi:dihydropteroate synthase